jgi:diketogulonate reductase-like aldo/keto reductase
MAATPVSQGDQFRTLADGTAMPTLGLGVWQVPDGPECVNAVRWALDAGYLHIDTAQGYGNEESVGKAVRESGIDREKLFITTKFNPALKDPAAEAKKSLARLGFDYVDLYLVHWPGGGPTWAWPGMQEAHAAGYARSIGVSNFSVTELDSLLQTADIVPAVNQVYFNPFAYRRGLLDACIERHVLIEAYSPLGTGRALKDPKVKSVAVRVGRSPAQVLLRWGIQHDLVVVGKSTHQERIVENMEVFEFVLSADDMAELDACDETAGTDRALERPWW